MGAVSKRAKVNKARADHERDEWYKSRGICPRCTVRYCKPGFVHCETCLEGMLDAKRRRDPTGEKKRQYDRERRQRAKERGLCPVCCKREPVAGRKECEICRQHKRDSQLKFRIHQQTIKEGLQWEP